MSKLRKVLNSKSFHLVFGVLALIWFVRSIPGGNFYEMLWWFQITAVFLLSAFDRGTVRFGAEKPKEGDEL